MATLTLTLGASADDAKINDFAYTDSDTTILVGGVGTAPLTNYGQGFRFTNVTLTDADTIINSATLKLMKSATHWATQHDRWTCVNEDNTATFSSGNPPGSRAIVATVVDESNNVNETDGVVYDFPRSAANQTAFGGAVADVIGRGGWASGNALAVVNNSDQDASAYEDIQRKVFHTYDSSTASSEPQLVIDYTSGGPPYVPTPPPTVNYIASGTVVTNGGGNMNVVPPNGRNNGDILILHKYSRDNVVGAVAEYTNILAQNQGSALRMEIWAKICGASEGSAVITRTAGTVMCAVLSCWRGNVNAGASGVLRAIDKPSGATYGAAASNETRIARYNNFAPAYGYERMVWAMCFGNDYATAHGAVTGTAPSSVQRYTNETTSGADLSGALSDGELKFANGALVGAGQSAFTNAAGGSAPYIGACFGIIPANAPYVWEMLPSKAQGTHIRM